MHSTTLEDGELSLKKTHKKNRKQRQRWQQEQNTHKRLLTFRGIIIHPENALRYVLGYYDI